MSIYKIPITTAFLSFPIIAFILTLPFLIYQYRKYGSIPFLRSVIFYSFILYLLCAYFLVILPLPSVEEVEKLTTPTMQLVPFDFVKDLSQISIQWTDFSSYLNVIKSPAFYIVAFNILLTVPLGIYLRYYFECKWYKALSLGFLLSLFFELTQLSGLYGIYPRPYRLFDVDDLILNSLGTIFGFLITPAIALFLPTRKELDEKSLEKGKRVTFFRRALAFCIDLFFWLIFLFIISIMMYNSNLKDFIMLISIFLYYIAIPMLTDGKTIGKMILNIQVISQGTKKQSRLKVMMRYFLSYILFYYQFVIINLLEAMSINNIIIDSIVLLLKLYFWVNVASILLNGTKKKKLFLYEKLTKTEVVSTIKRENPEETKNLNPVEESREEEKQKKDTKRTKKARD